MNIIKLLTRKRKKVSSDKKQQKVGSPATMNFYEYQLWAANEALSKLQDEYRALNDKYRTSTDENRVLKDKVDALQQGQDFRSHYGAAGPPHDKMQERLERIGPEIQGWVRKFLLPPKTSIGGNKMASKTLFDLATPGVSTSEFKDALSIICPESTESDGLDALREVKLQDALAAIVANLIVGQVIMDPWGRCTPQLQEVASSAIYKAMSDKETSTEYRRAAKIWQASCFKFYNSSLETENSLGTVEQKTEAMEGHINFVTSKVLDTLEAVFNRFNLTDDQHSSILSGNQAFERKRRLQGIIRKAVEIGKDLSELQSGLVIMDKQWLQEHHTEQDGYISPSSLGRRVELKLPTSTKIPGGDQCEKPIKKARVSIVLFPGLLKYGSDDGQNWESWSVWIPAKIQLTDVDVMTAGDEDQESQSNPVQSQYDGGDCTMANNSCSLESNSKSLSGSRQHHPLMRRAPDPYRSSEGVQNNPGPLGAVDLVMAHGKISQPQPWRPPPPSNPPDAGSESNYHGVRGKSVDADYDHDMAYGPVGYMRNETMIVPDPVYASSSGTRTRTGAPKLATGTNGGGFGLRPGSSGQPQPATTTTPGLYGSSTTRRFANAHSSPNNHSGNALYHQSTGPTDATTVPVTAATETPLGSTTGWDNPLVGEDTELGPWHPMDIDGIEGADSGEEEDVA